LRQMTAAEYVTYCFPLAATSTVFSIYKSMLIFF
jgi:hypothetical protein